MLPALGAAGLQLPGGTLNGAWRTRAEATGTCVCHEDQQQPVLLSPLRRSHLPQAGQKARSRPAAARSLFAALLLMLLLQLLVLLLLLVTAQLPQLPAQEALPAAARNLFAALLLLLLQLVELLLAPLPQPGQNSCCCCYHPCCSRLQGRVPAALVSPDLAQEPAVLRWLQGGAPAAALLLRQAPGAPAGTSARC